MLAAVRLQDPRAAEEHGAIPPAPAGAVRAAGGRPTGNLRPPSPAGAPQGEGHPEPPAPAGRPAAGGTAAGAAAAPPPVPVRAPAQAQAGAQGPHHGPDADQGHQAARRVDVGLPGGHHDRGRHVPHPGAHRRVHEAVRGPLRGPQHQRPGRDAHAGAGHQRARRARAHQVGQRLGVHREGRTRRPRPARHQDPLHRPRLALAERLHRIVQRLRKTRAPRPRAVLHALRGPGRVRRLDRRLQRLPSPRRYRLPHPARVHGMGTGPAAQWLDTRTA